MPQIGTTSKLSVNVVNVGRFVVDVDFVRYFHMLNYLYGIFPSALLLVLRLFSIKRTKQFCITNCRKGGHALVAEYFPLTYLVSII